MIGTENSDVTWVWKTTASCGAAASAAVSARRARQLARTDQLPRSSGTRRSAPCTSNGTGSQVAATAGCCSTTARKLRACVT